jgi:hypothetical protein
MRPITLDEILSYADYERIRPRLRPMLIAEKDRRRLMVGEHLTLLFENDRTVWYQIQEMIRTERIAGQEAIQHEIDTYNELLPSRGELSATMLVQFAEPAERDKWLKELLGLDQHIWMTIGSRRIRGRFDQNQMDEERISSVQFVRFAAGVDGSAFIASARGGQVVLEVGHPRLTAKAPIDLQLASALAEDLSTR